MNAVMQEITDHDPDSGIYGDCFRAALATILDLPIHSVPHYMQIHHPDIDLALREYGKFLAGLGYMIVVMPGRVFMDLIRDTGMDCYHLIIANSAELNGQVVGHALVGLNGRIVHNPIPGGEEVKGTVDDWQIGVFVKTFVAKQGTNQGNRNDD
jgi:hypothetical protein